LTARRSVGIYTPTVPNLRIAWLANAGEYVEQGSPILRFDSSTAQMQLMQKESQLKQAQATLEQAIAQSKITSEQDRAERANVGFALERAKVEVDLQAIKSSHKAEVSRIDLAVAEQKVKVQEATLKLHEASDKARIASLTRQLEQVRADVDLYKERIAQMELKAPGSGILTLNLNTSGVILSSDARPYKVGDNVNSGIVLGQIPDLKSLELDSKLEESDRGRVTVGQDVTVRVDAFPEASIAARVTAISKLAELQLEYPYTRSFRVYASILHPDPRLRSGMNGGMDIVVNRIHNAIRIPSRALFTRAGKPFVYLLENGRYRLKPIELLARNPDEAAISGIPANSSVALVDNERQERKP
jgi:multidrug efflux pump subunit AcrA (membrane-fusion protein)